MNKITSKYSPEVRERAVRMVLDNQGQWFCSAYRMELEGQSFRKQEAKSGDETPAN